MTVQMAVATVDVPTALPQPAVSTAAPGPLVKKPSRRQLSEIQKVFAIFDKNGDGFIDEAELTIVLSALSVEKKEIQNIIKDIDKNGDGKVCLDEFIALIMQRKNPSKKVSPSNARSCAVKQRLAGQRCSGKRASRVRLFCAPHLSPAGRPRSSSGR